MKIKTQYINTCGNSYKQVYSDKCIFKKTERSQINKLTLHLKELSKEQQAKPKFSRRKEITKISRNKKNREGKTIEKN